MPDKLSVEDVQSEQADRGSDGDLIPVTEEIKWNGSTKEIDVYPITTGIANEISQYEAGLAELNPEAVSNVVNTCCPHLELSPEDIDALPIEQVNKLITPITDQLPEVEPGNQ